MNIIHKTLESLESLNKNGIVMERNLLFLRNHSEQNIDLNNVNWIYILNDLKDISLFKQIIKIGIDSIKNSDIINEFRDLEKLNIIFTHLKDINSSILKSGNEHYITTFYSNGYINAANLAFDHGLDLNKIKLKKESHPLNIIFDYQQPEETEPFHITFFNLIDITNKPLEILDKHNLFLTENEKVISYFIDNSHYNDGVKVLHYVSSLGQLDNIVRCVKQNINILSKDEQNLTCWDKIQKQQDYNKPFRYEEILSMAGKAEAEKFKRFSIFNKLKNEDDFINLVYSLIRKEITDNLPENLHTRKPNINRL